MGKSFSAFWSTLCVILWQMIAICALFLSKKPSVPVTKSSSFRDFISPKRVKKRCGKSSTNQLDNNKDGSYQHRKSKPQNLVSIYLSHRNVPFFKHFIIWNVYIFPSQDNGLLRRIWNVYKHIHTNSL